MSIFGSGDLRRAQDWTGSRWLQARERPDLVGSILSGLNLSQDPIRSAATPSAEDASHAKQGGNNSGMSPGSGDGKSGKMGMVPDLSKDNRLSQLRWKSSRKRCRGSPGRGRNIGRKSPDSSDSYMISASLKVADHDDCKYSRGDQAIFNSSVVPSLTTNLVMCR